LILYKNTPIYDLSNIRETTTGDCLKIPPPPSDVPSKYSSSKEEEKVIVLNISTFPSFSKEGCHARRVMTGWLKKLLRQPLFFILVVR
jgi:hypothetical protein